MSEEVALLIKKEFALDATAGKLLTKNIKTLDKMERRYFYRLIRPLEKEIRAFLSGYYHAGDADVRMNIEEATVQSLLNAGGDPDLADSMVMDAVGRIKIYRLLRERSESEGIKISALNNFGGLSMVLLLVVIITAVILYMLNR